MRVCKECGEEKPVEAFAFRRRASQLRLTVCRVCYGGIRRRKRPPITTRICLICHIEKPVDAYTRGRGVSSSALRKTCHECVARAQHAERNHLKICRGCQAALPLDHFYKIRPSHHLRRSKCIACIKAYDTLPSTRIRTRANTRKYATGFSVALWELTLMLQQFQCAICLVKLNPSSRFAHADHCHRTKQPRGILCSKCNTAIGLLQENQTIIQRAAQYLEQPTLFARQEWEDLL